jgi:prepilin-type N-terminal cleavage/methylation domain-containing protein
MMGIQKKSGFTFLETLFAMSIVLILAAIVIEKRINQKPKPVPGVTVLPPTADQNPDYKKYLELYEGLKSAGLAGLVFEMADRELRPRILGYNDDLKIVYVNLGNLDGHPENGKGGIDSNRVYFNGKHAALHCGVCELPTMEQGKIKKVSIPKYERMIYSNE